MRVICISGKARHGKDTVAEYLKRQLQNKGERVLIAHYADLVKYVCKTFFGWDGEKDREGRDLLQFVGTNVVRTKSPNYWVDFISNILRFFPDEWDYALIPDCRFPNEVEKLITDGHDVFHLRVVRSNVQSPLTRAQQNHPSETALDNFPADYTVHNNETLCDLQKEVDKFIRRCGI